MVDYLLKVNLTFIGEKLMPTQRTFLAFRGRDRKAIHKLQKTLLQLQEVDIRRASAAAASSTTPTLFHMSGEVNEATKITDLIARCNEALAQKVTLKTV